MDQRPSDYQLFFNNLVVIFGAYEYIFALFDLLINSFHVFILSRRHMRTSSINSILLGIALIDMVFPVVAIKKQIRIWVFGTGNCSAPEGYWENQVNWILYTLRDDFRRCSTWLGLSLAAVRTIAVRNSMKQSYNHISQSSLGWKIVVSALLSSSFISIFYYLRYEVKESGTYWKAAISCPGYNPDFTAPIYMLQEREFFTVWNSLIRKIYLVTTGVLSKFLPCLLFPFFTILLIRELGKAKETRLKTNKAGVKKDLTTRLVVYITVSFFIIEFPIGICLLFEAASPESNNNSTSVSIIQLLNMLYVIMTLTHFFICFSMSTQYRQTVKYTFCLRPKVRVSGVSVIGTPHSFKSNTDSAFH